jgi:valyl-tRNA synthetase
MMMAGLYFMEEVPFHTVYMHALVRDEKGQKMSKSKGNVLDPLEMIETYSADALRFTLAAMAAQGRDVKMSPARVEGYRNFATKLWNVARFTQMNGCRIDPGFDPHAVEYPINRWILGETERTARTVTQAIEQHRYNDAANTLYSFVWGTFCDWYVELIKPALNGPDGAVKTETQAAASWTLDQILKLLHPFMPFITEELWDKLAQESGVERDDLLCLSDWPHPTGLADQEADRELSWVVELISEIRSVRAEMNVPASAKAPVVLVGADETTRRRAKTYEDSIARLARLESISFADEAAAGAIQTVVDETIVALPLADVIDIAAERDRLRKEIEKVGSEIEKIDKKLANEQFVSRAPEHVVDEQRERRAEAEAAAQRLQAALKRLESAA